MNPTLVSQEWNQLKPEETSQKQILLVDDDPAIRRIIARLLVDEGYFAHTAADGEQAMRVASTHHLDLVLLDLNMPYKDGWQTLESLQTAQPELPVIIITARPNQFFTALASGVGALLEKPLDFTSLFKAVRELLSESPAERQSRTTGRPAPFHYISAVPGVR